MPNHRRLKHLLLSAALLALLARGLAITGDRGLPPAHGILNFGKINDHLYRGAEPHAVGVENLKQLGVATIIDLRMPGEISPEERATARANGITYTNVPLKGLGRPADDQITRVLSIIETSSAPVFVHCEHGCDRTGTVIACYRLSHDHWTLDAAITEANLYGMSGLEHGMRSFIADYAKSAKKKN